MFSVGGSSLERNALLIQIHSKVKRCGGSRARGHEAAVT